MDYNCKKNIKHYIIKKNELVDNKFQKITISAICESFKPMLSSILSFGSKTGLAKLL